MVRRLLYVTLLASLLLVIAFLLLWKIFSNTPLTTKTPQILYIPPGSSINTVAASLSKDGILKHPSFFIWLAHLEGQAKKLKAGEYLLTPGITPIELLKKIVAGKVVMRQITIVEGWTLKQVYASMKANRYLMQTIEKLTPLDISNKLGTGLSLEGFLYPDTYLFARGVPDLIILKKAHVSMQSKLIKLWQTRSADLPFNDAYAALIAASLIEKETARPEERAKIAGVIIRRLQKGMPLQIDASVIYGLGEEYTGQLTHDDLNKDTPYNTYLHKGLPPTPIAMPSLASIVAALHPEQGTALYYVARGDGTHAFSATLEEHHQAVKKFRGFSEQFNVKLPSTPYVPWFDSPNLDQLNLLSNPQPITLSGS